MSEEEKKAIEYFNRRIKNVKTLYTSIYFKVKNLKIILNLIEKQDKMIDLMAEHIDEQNDILCDYDSSIAYLPCNENEADTIDKCLKDECKNCVKEYFRKKVENDN